MALPEDDVRYLAKGGYDYDLTPNGNEQILLIRRFPVNAGRFNHAEVELLLVIPAGYNITKLDMFYVWPALQYIGGGMPPTVSEGFTFLGRPWQRFSRHLEESQWNKGVDGLAMFMSRIQDELQGNG